MALADVDKLLDQLTLPITRCMVFADDRPVLKLLNQVDKKKIHGRALSANIPMKFTPAGSFGLMGEAGALPAGKQSTSDEGSIGVKKLAMSFDFTSEQIIAMEGGRAGLHETLDGELRDGMKAFKGRQLSLFAGGHGDGVVGRVVGSITGAKVVTCSTPVLAVEGDVLQSWDERDTNTRSGNNQTTDNEVVAVNYENRTITFADNATIDTLKLLGYHPEADQSSSKFLWPAGIPGIVDNPLGLGTTVMYDQGDLADADYDHVDTYLGKTRSTGYPKLNATTYDAGGAVCDEEMLAMGAALSMGAGQKVSRTVYLMNPKQYRRILKYFAGKLEVASQAKIILPGGEEMLPTIMITGAGQMPVIQTYYIPDGMYLCLGINDFNQFTVPGSWVTQGGSKKLLLPDGAGSYLDKYRYSFIGYWNTYCVCVSKQVAVFNLSTA